jgi:anion-transporting  ArsA/GET3 family ATPase
MSDSTPQSLDQILAQRRVLVTCGTGGVGKTTLSAAIALRAALLGRKAVVVTIDPAKRLKTSLGLTELGDEPTDLTERAREAFAQARAQGLALPTAELTGTLHAVVPDTRRTFESFVRELAPTEALGRRIMDNPIFQIFAREFSGSNEYMALERLLALHETGRFDCIILDTPPSRNTLAFLDAPRVLAQFFEERFVKWLVLPANKLVAAGVRKAMGVLEKLTGGGFVKNLFDFASDLFEVQANFTANLGRITKLLESSEVGFLMVTTPTPETVPEVSRFVRIVGEHRFRFDGLVLNRTLGHLRPPTAGESAEQPGLAEGLAIVAALQARERPVLDELAKNRIPLCASVPELARDVHSVEDLLHVAMALHPADLAPAP